MKRYLLITLIILAFYRHTAAGAIKQNIELTLNSAVRIAMDNSYRIKQLRLGIERTRLWLQAERAGLKSRIYMNISAPEIEDLSDYKWNSLLQRDEIVRQSTQRWQMDLSVRQPVVLFGYPTDGYLSLNNQMYRYLQKDPNGNDISYYNRYFLKFEQPFFLPNNLKNKIELAELNLKSRELEYIDDQIEFLRQIADDYYTLFKLSYTRKIYEWRIENLNEIARLVYHMLQQDSTRTIETIQVQVELANVQEKLLQNQSDIRIATSRLKQRLRLNGEDNLIINPNIYIVPVKVNVEEAIQYGYTLRPQLRSLANNKRRDEIDLENVKGWNAFHMNLEMTYGIEKQDDSYRQLWGNSDNSNSVTLTAYIPLWDWGQRQARIEAQEISIKKTDLDLEEIKNRIASDITNAVSNLDEYQERALKMQENMEIAKEITAQSMILYQNGKISLQDLLQTIIRQSDTEFNFLEVYLGYRKSLLTLMTNTYYDYENSISLLDQFKMQ
ncbi:MAG TPA: TolC family protein [bacterium]|nr:TolC family protein [bacterium]HPN45593.1 TolC family protein [bacterium]